MKKFGANNNSVIPPQMGQCVYIRCRNCGNLFRAKSAGIFDLFSLPVCPKCGSSNTVKDMRVMN